MSWSQRLLAALFTYTGIMHFVKPRMYEAIMPPFIPAHHELVLISGAAEIVGALAVLRQPTRRFGRWWLFGLLIAVFPANIYMATNYDDLRITQRLPRWTWWARLPLQPLAMYWVWRATED